MNLNTNANFTKGQLALIQSVAVECAQPDPTSRISEARALFETVRDYCSGFTADELVVLDLISKQCDENKLGAMTMYECIAEFARIYHGDELLGQLPALCANAVRACMPLEPFISPIQLPNGQSITPRVGNPGFCGPFSLN